MNVLTAALLAVVLVALTVLFTTGTTTLVCLVGLIAVSLTYEHYVMGTFSTPVEADPTEHGV